METMKEFVGSRLTNGSFLQMNQEISVQITTATAEALKVEQLSPLYTDALERLSVLINRQTGYAETADVSRHDQNRDALFRSIYWAIDYLHTLDPSSSLYRHVQQLLPAIAPYRGIADHELTKETSEITGFIASLSSKPNADAVKALGLSPLIEALDSENTDVSAALSNRTSTAATRAQATGDASTDRVRREVVDVYRRIVARVNAVAELEPSAAVTGFIRQANAIGEHYATVMANQGKTGATSAPAPQTRTASE
ncbi:DUF6261 family protein [Bacteroides sp. GD17]|jgi:hypothetical protein|uniref:DUF6261 family protein n=1 Tax=Bacteroides sp. GD17 TaxID=3139826 RepID=UPI0025DB07DA|nr:DUF6261 family protein [uncultured Bacteroides sp.]